MTEKAFKPGHKFGLSVGEVQQGVAGKSEHIADMGVPVIREPEGEFEQMALSRTQAHHVTVQKGVLRRRGERSRRCRAGFFIPISGEGRHCKPHQLRVSVNSTQHIVGPVAGRTNAYSMHGGLCLWKTGRAQTSVATQMSDQLTAMPSRRKTSVQ